MLLASAASGRYSTGTILNLWLLFSRIHTVYSRVPAVRQCNSCCLHHRNPECLVYHAHDDRRPTIEFVYDNPSCALPRATAYHCLPLLLLRLTSCAPVIVWLVLLVVGCYARGGELQYECRTRLAATDHRDPFLSALSINSNAFGGLVENYWREEKNRLVDYTMVHYRLVSTTTTEYRAAAAAAAVSSC